MKERRADWVCLVIVGVAAALVAWANGDITYGAMFIWGVALGSFLMLFLEAGDR